MGKLTTIRTHLRNAAAYRNTAQQLLDVMLHKLIINISPSDYYRFEFYKGPRSWEEKSRYVALNGSRYWPFEGNEFKYTTTLSNKYIQKHMLMGFGLPTPRLISTLGDAMEIRDEASFAQFIHELDRDVVIKPVSSAGGEGVWVMSKREGEFFSDGNSCTLDEIWSCLNKRMDRGYLIEERVYNTGVLRQLNPDCLNTFRVVTIKTNDGCWHVAAVSVKIGGAGAVADNNSQGGVQINLDEKGRAYHAYDFASREPLTCFHGTQTNLMEIEYDGFDAVTALALRASSKFGFLGTVGWDIAYTETGPMVIEGNIVWGCSSLQRGRPGIITDGLASKLNVHHAWSRWNRSRLYPGYDRPSLLKRLRLK